MVGLLEQEDLSEDHLDLLTRQHLQDHRDGHLADLVGGPHSED